MSKILCSAWNLLVIVWKNFKNFKFKFLADGTRFAINGSLRSCWNFVFEIKEKLLKLFFFFFYNEKFFKLERPLICHNWGKGYRIIRPLFPPFFRESYQFFIASKLQLLWETRLRTIKLKKPPIRLKSKNVASNPRKNYTCVGLIRIKGTIQKSLQFSKLKLFFWIW